MLEHDYQYFAIDLTEIIEQSYQQMLAWANHWQNGVYYHSMKRAKVSARHQTISIWWIWNPDIIEAVKKVFTVTSVERNP